MLNTLNQHSSSCPLCQRSTHPSNQPVLAGLIICYRCQERRINCPSGHYVRDPFISKPMPATAPSAINFDWVRRLQELPVLPYSLLVMMLGGSVTLGVYLLVWQGEECFLQKSIAPVVEQWQP